MVHFLPVVIDSMVGLGRWVPMGLVCGCVGKDGDGDGAEQGEHGDVDDFESCIL
jgi:hypothetical protein